MPRSAAGQIYPHLPSGERPEVQQRTPGLADALHPGLSRAGKAREADQRLWATILKRNRDNLVRGLREANGKRGR
jgi:hypothetical protein